MRISLILPFALLAALINQIGFTAEPPDDPPSPIRLLIVDGQNNHGTWPKTTFLMKTYLQGAGFQVDVARTAYAWNGGKYLEQFPLEGVSSTPTSNPTPDPNFSPEFSNYQVVLSNFGYAAAPWPDETRTAFEEYVRGGGGFVVVHAADNSFGNWKQYNEMIGVGGWGGRSAKSGPYVYLNADGTEIRETKEGPTGSHGPMHAFPIVIRDHSHPITRDMPQTWLHYRDELYDYLRGPAVNMTVLATAHSAKDKHGSGNHVPMMMTINFGKGRVFHTPMGHDDQAMQCVGYITTLLRGAEWAATGKVTIPIPDDFPTVDAVSRRE